MRIHKGSISYLLLTILEKTVDGYVRFEDIAYHPSLYKDPDKPLPKSSISHALRRLRDSGLVVKVKINQKTVWKLNCTTDSLKDSTEDKAWDGKWRIVIFDIPEVHRRLRNLLRRTLKKWGFVQHQKSVWVTKKNVFDKVVDFINEAQMCDWVTVIESNRLTLVDVTLDDRSSSHQLV